MGIYMYHTDHDDSDIDVCKIIKFLYIYGEDSFDGDLVFTKCQ